MYVLDFQSIKIERNTAETWRLEHFIFDKIQARYFWKAVRKAGSMSSEDEHKTII
jgi:hypothetical protein